MAQRGLVAKARGYAASYWKQPAFGEQSVLGTHWLDVRGSSGFLSAIATGLSWLFYYKALQLGEASRVAPIDKFSVTLAVGMAFVFLGEKPTTGNVVGAILVTAGVLVAALVQ